MEPFSICCGDVGRLRRFVGLRLLGQIVGLPFGRPPRSTFEPLKVAVELPEASGGCQGSRTGFFVFFDGRFRCWRTGFC